MSGPQRPTEEAIICEVSRDGNDAGPRLVAEGMKYSIVWIDVTDLLKACYGTRSGLLRRWRCAWGLESVAVVATIDGLTPEVGGLAVWA